VVGCSSVQLDLAIIILPGQASSLIAGKMGRTNAFTPHGPASADLDDRHVDRMQ